MSIRKEGLVIQALFSFSHIYKKIFLMKSGILKFESKVILVLTRNGRR